MRILCRVVFGDKSCVIDVACGDGDKTVKWLATVATQRLSMDHAPRGRIRQRDTLTLVPYMTALQPSGVETHDEPFYDPDAKLTDCFEDGQEVRIIVNPTATSSRWSIIAQTHSEGRQWKKQEALDEEARLREAKLRHKEQEEEAKRVAENKAKADAMRARISKQLLSQDQLEPAMQKEWEWMNRRGLMDTWIRSDKERDHVFAKLRDNLASLLELFRFYGASTTGAADAHLMEFVEFIAFCRDIALFGGTNDVNHTTLAAGFAECAAVENVADVKAAHFVFGDFLSSLVWLALTTKGGGAENDRDAIGNLLRSHDLARQGSAFSTSAALQQLFDENLQQAFRTHQSQLIGPITKEKLATDEILAVFYEHREPLQNVFTTYLAAKPDPLDMNDGLMTMNEYLLLLEDSRLIGSSNDHDLLTAKEVRQAFAGAQDDFVVAASAAKAPMAAALPRASRRSTPMTKQQPQSLLLSFAEFLEAILRLALLKWDDETFTTTQKLNMAITALLTYPYNSADARPMPAARRSPAAASNTSQPAAVMGATPTPTNKRASRAATPKQ